MAKQQTPAQLVETLIASGMSEQEIADAVKTSQPTIHRIGKGSIQNPNFQTVDSLRALVDALPKKSSGKTGGARAA